MIAFLLIANLIAKGIGSLQPPNPALQGFTQGCENKPQPCWYGIEPSSVMSLDEIIRNLEKATFVVTQHEDRVTALTSIEGFQRITNCTVYLNYVGPLADVGRITLDCPMMLGDYILMAGTPETIAACGGLLYFDKGTIKLMPITNQTRYWALSPYTSIKRMFVSLTEYNPPTIWIGYAPLWKYAQADIYLHKSCSY